jgi:polysaccharide chain length determinant protein (PEP-CTERM system associated)
MIPGRRYTPEDIIALALRFKWLILLPWIAIAGGAAFFARTLPDQFRSESLIQVVAQRVPENLVRSTINERIEDRLPVISATILSRTRLERIVTDFGLYQEEKKSELMEDIIADMRKDINVVPVKGDAFKVSFVADNARMSMRVTERLATYFVDENLRDRAQIAEGANSFLESQLDDAKRTLLDQEKKLEDYKRQYVGQLPSQLQGNLQAIATMQNQITQTAQDIRADQDRRAGLERTITDLETESAMELQRIQLAQQAAANDPASAGSQPAAAQLAKARAQLTGLELKYKADHPEVRQWKTIIRELESKAQEEQLATPVSGTAIMINNPGEVARRKQADQAKFQIEQLDKQTTEKAQTIKRLQGQIAAYEAKVDATPTRDSEMVALNRDYDTLSKLYTTTLGKSQDAKMAANLERRQIGEQFKIIDQARLPGRPFSPNRAQIYLGGIFGGLLFGVGIVGLLEYRDSSLRSENDVVAALALPVLATIPAIMTSRDRRVEKRRKKMVLLASATVVALAAGVVVAWKMRLFDRLF